jgi:exopolyphosphatase/pppGpp-phosphohydrolase
LTLGSTSLWNQWRSGLPANGQVAEAAQARLLATTRAADPNRSKSSATARLARKLFRELKRANVSPIFKDEQLETTMQAVALLHGIDPENSGKNANKDARKFLAELPPPPGWTSDQWQLLSLAVRYRRGAAPSPERGRFAKLEPARQAKLLLLSGILRIARAWRKTGTLSAARLRVESKSDSIQIFAEGFPQAHPPSNGLVVGKHLLEGALGKIITIRALEAVEPVLPLEFVPSELRSAAGAG